MKDTEIFYFDVDGTLLDNHSHKIPQSTVYALNKLKEKGYQIALCTGRTVVGCEDVSILDMFDWDGYVLANGAEVFGKGMQPIRSLTFDPAWIEAFIDAHPGPILLEGDTLQLIHEPSEHFLKSLAHFGVERMDVSTYNNEKVYNIMSYGFDAMLDEDKARLLKGMNVVLDQMGNREIMPLGAGKDQGVKVLNDHLGVSRFTGFGDGHNDVTFLESATHSFAMGNGCDEVKEVATYITDRVDEDGIYNALVQHGIIEEKL